MCSRYRHTKLSANESHLWCKVHRWVFSTLISGLTECVFVKIRSLCLGIFLNTHQSGTVSLTLSCDRIYISPEHQPVTKLEPILLSGFRGVFYLLCRLKHFSENVSWVDLIFLVPPTFYFPAVWWLSAPDEAFCLCFVLSVWSGHISIIKLWLKNLDKMRCLRERSAIFFLVIFITFLLFMNLYTEDTYVLVSIYCHYIVSIYNLSVYKWSIWCIWMYKRFSSLFF